LRAFVALSATAARTPRSATRMQAGAGKGLDSGDAFVDFLADFQVEEVDFLEDLDVQQVDSLPLDCGQWEIVDSLPDFTVEKVDSLPDFTVKYVDFIPGIP
jgi:hypothetical protein